ncbi:DENN domain-containing protein 1C isoform X1 [Pundamilia nyererei]|uniref:DENN domain-containing protein 1C isoform X1 n=1 Tax=Pundamilia nyererei TaxID=303518 RepID=A0A9Y3RUA2_9CICH|nr:PREDICTED: DENN domain-containing protein 1C-like isoform X1 [Pundamilia nyererei]
MGSRLKQNPERTFYWFFEATCPVARDKDPGLLFQFPEDFNDEESCQTLPRFCFPYDIQRVRDGVAVQHFTFVLTDLEGCQRFGFCRLTNSTHTCLCILSYLPWFEVFYKLLNNLADYLSKGQTSEMKVLLASLYNQPLPLAAGSVTLQMGEQVLVSTEVSHPVGHSERQKGVPYFIAPDPRSLPSIPENRNLTELIVAVDVGNLLQLYASMLFERRILIFASKLSTLTSCVHALSAVLYPMYWQHIFIPVLPPHLLDYCCAPMPYLIGVHSSLSERVRSRGLEEVVILNVDTNTLETPFDDHKRIPSDVMSGLKMCLKRQAVSPGCGVSQAFLKAQALLFGGYRDALQPNEEGEICFCENLFSDHKSPSMKHFLQSAVHLQCFKQFIDARLDILNNKNEPDDLFEEEIIKCESTAGRGKSYQQLVGNLKKGGGALILNMKSKANMRAKVLAKSGLKNLLIHKVNDEEHTLQRGGSVSHRRAQSDCLQNRLPITQHFGRSRPRRPAHKSKTPRDKDIMKDSEDTWDGAMSGSRTEPDSELQKDEEEEDEEEEDALLCDEEEMDLLGEIFDTLSSRSSHDRGLLYGTRSLDLFGPDSHDFITRRVPTNPSQESLSLSISGSGSLHSWNLETTEELSDLTADTDWPCMDTSVPEEKGLENMNMQSENKTEEPKNGQRQDGEKQEEVTGAINGNQAEETDDQNKFKEVKLEENIEKQDPGEGVSLWEDPVNEICAKSDEGLKENKEDEQNQTEEVIAEPEMERETHESPKAREEEKESQLEKNEVVRGSLSKLINPNPKHPNSVEEEQNQGKEAVPDTTVSPGPQIPAVDPNPTSVQEKKIEVATEKLEQEVKQTPSPPKVLSAAARFQSQGSTQSFQVKSRVKAFTEPGKPCTVFRNRENAQMPCDSNTSETNNRTEEAEEEERPPVKVSELKKRFEA